MLPDSYEVRVNVRPSERQLSDLCESVGWSRFGPDYVALDGYSATTSAWTSEVAWLRGHLSFLTTSATRFCSM
jgi:hypothetical protein